MSQTGTNHGTFKQKSTTEDLPRPPKSPRIRTEKKRPEQEKTLPPHSLFHGPFPSVHLDKTLRPPWKWARPRPPRPAPRGCTWQATGAKERVHGDGSQTGAADVPSSWNDWFNVRYLSQHCSVPVGLTSWRFIGFGDQCWSISCKSYQTNQGGEQVDRRLLAACSGLAESRINEGFYTTKTTSTILFMVLEV